CITGNCTTMLLLEVGNTGTMPQENVRIRFHAEPLRRAVLPLTVRNFGKVDRPVKTNETGGQLAYDLGRLQPQKRVELRTVFHAKESEGPPSWNDILIGVEPATGEARAGDPASVMFARMMNAFFWWL